MMSGQLKLENYEAILFDMDGVLVDVSQSYRLAIQYTAEHFLGQPIVQDEITAFKKQGGYNNDWDLTEAIIQKHGMAVDRDDIIDRFQQFYLGENFKGFIQNEKLPGIMENFDIFVMPSIEHSETFGVSAVEAQALEIPVVD